MKRVSLRLLFICLVLGAVLSGAVPCMGQLRTDTTVTHVGGGAMPQQVRKPDTAKSYAGTPSREDSLAFAMRSHPFQPNPKRAGLYSALVPGLGQLYNRQYWKIPVVYTGLSVAGYYIVKNLTEYQSYRIAYIGRLNNPHPTDKYLTVYPDASQLQQLQNDSKKYLDMSVLFTGLGYMLQVLDAVTSAHLKNFDISRDISFHVMPVATPFGAGMGLVANF